MIIIYNNKLIKINNNNNNKLKINNYCIIMDIKNKLIIIINIRIIK